jgi:hypothetical protein
MSTDTLLDPSALQGLDFPVPCGHSMHSKGGMGHSGDAKYVAVSYHRCQARTAPAPPYYYPCCEAWALLVMANTAAGAMIQCSRCRDGGYWEDMVKIVSTLT